MRPIKLIVLLLFSFCKISLSQTQFVLVDYDTAYTYFANVDGVPIQTYKGFVIMPRLEYGKHELMLIDKNQHSITQKFEIIVGETPMFMHLSRYKDALFLGISNPDLYQEKNENKLDEISVRADEISVEQKDKVATTDCQVLSETEFSHYMNAYYLMDSKSQLEKTKKYFATRCLTLSQLDLLMQATLDAGDRIALFEILQPRVLDKAMLDTMSVYFENTPYYSKFLTLRTQKP